MDYKRSTAWIGLQKTQTSLNILKEEVEKAEKKMILSKKSFYKVSKLDSWTKTVALNILESKQHSASFETLLHKVPMHPHVHKYASEKGDGDAVTLSDLSEEPNLVPPLAFMGRKHVADHLNDSFLHISSTDSVKSDVLSSEGTSSLIACTYLTAPDLHQKYKADNKSFPAKASCENENENNISMQKPVASSFSIDGMEWQSVNENKVTHLSRLKPEGILKLHDIIELQKKRQKTYEKQLENQPPPVNEPDSFHLSQNPIPTRKVCQVKSLPSYKGFCSPPSKKWSLRKRKSSTVKIRSAESSEKNLRKVFQFANDSLKRKRQKKENFLGTVTLDNEVSLPQVDAEERVPDISCEQSLPQVDAEPEVVIEPHLSAVDAEIDTDVQKSFHLITDAEVKENVPPASVQGIICSSSDEEKSSSKMVESRSSYSKKSSNIFQPSISSKTPHKSKTTLSKKSQSEEKKAVSPKIRHYDVQKVRAYIQKKKAEHRKRVLEELKNSNFKAQKKKDCLEKLIKEQKEALLAKKKSSLDSKVKESFENNAQNGNVSSSVNVVESTNAKLPEIDQHSSVHAIIEKQDSSKKFSEANKRPLSPEKKLNHVCIDMSMHKLVSTSQTMNALEPTKELEDQKSVGNLKEVDDEVSSEVVHVSQTGDFNEMQNKSASGMVDLQAFQDSFHSVSSISSLNDLLKMPGFDPNILESLKPFTSKSKISERKCEVLKDLVNSINESTKPLEPFLRVKEWVQTSSLSDHALLGHHKDLKPEERQSRSYSVPEKVKPVSKRLGTAAVKKAVFNKSTFKEQVSSIGDVSKLYEKILGKPAVTSSFSSNPNMDVSDNVHPSSQFGSFSDLQVQKVPDPFNVINTWSRKSFELLKSQPKGNPPIPFSGVAVNTSVLDSSHISQSSSNLKHNLEMELSNSFSNHPSSFVKDQMTDVTNRESLELSLTMPPCDPENLNKLHELTPNLSKHSLAKDNGSLTDLTSSKTSPSSIPVLPKFPSDASNTFSNNEVQLPKQLNDSGSTISDDSGRLVSGSITSEYSLEEDGNDTDVGESTKDKESLSRSSESEVISVVENSLGIQNSAIDSSSDTETSLTQHSIADSDLCLTENGHSGSKKELETKEAARNRTNASFHAKSFSSHSSSGWKRIFNGSASNALDSALDHEFHQPLGLPTSQGTYLHSQVVTRIASEAAAAATSAVMAVFQTQKMLLSENNCPLPRSLTQSRSSKKSQYSNDFESSKSSTSSMNSVVPSKASISEKEPEISESKQTSIISESKSSSKSASSVNTEANSISQSSKSDEKIKYQVSTNPSCLSSNSSVCHEDTFTKLTSDVIRQIAYDEKVKALHELSSLRVREKELVERARTEMLWLQMLKKKVKKEGDIIKASTIKQKQKELLLHLRHKRVELHHMQEAYKNICEKQKSSYSKWLEEENHFLNSSISELEVNTDSQNSSPADQTSALKDEESKPAQTKGASSEVPESIEHPSSEFPESASISELIEKSPPKSELMPANLPHSPENSILRHSTENAVQELKQIEATKRHLNKREQRILQRHKEVESLLQRQRDLDKAEMIVRELEQKALKIVDESKKKSKYYVSSSESTNPTNGKQDEFNGKSSSLLKTCNEISEADLSVKSNSDNGSKSSLGAFVGEPSPVEENMEASIVNGNSVSEDVRSSSLKSSIETVANSSQLEFSVAEEISNQVSSSSKEQSSGSTRYSESFESSTSRHSSEQRVPAKKGPDIRLPLVPLNAKRHDSSGSDDSYAISHSQSASDQSDLEVRVHALAEELRIRKKEAEQLKQKQKRKYREHLKEKEQSLQKQIEAYNQYIQQVKGELDHGIKSSVSVKPYLKRTPDEQKEEFHYRKKQGVLYSQKKIHDSEASNSTVLSSDAKQSVSEATSENSNAPSSKEVSDNISLNAKELSEAVQSDLPHTAGSIEISEAITALLSEVSESYSNNSVSNGHSNLSNEPKAGRSDTLPSVEVPSEIDGSRTVSSSEADTFISESSKSSYATEGSRELSSLEPCDTLSTKNESASQKSSQDNRGSDNYSENVTFGDSPISAVQTESNSSPDENESSDCSGPHGCSKQLPNVLGFESGDHFVQCKAFLGLSVLSSSARKEPGLQTVHEGKKTISSSFIDNIVNLLSTDLSDEAIKTFIRIGKKCNSKKCFIGDFRSILLLNLNASHSKPVDATVQFLLNFCLNDSFQCIFSVSRLAKKPYSQNVLINQAVLNERSRHEVSNYLELVNGSRLLNNNPVWNSEKAVSQFHSYGQQLPLQQYSYYYRKIPNKPPPPYTPPTTTLDSSTLSKSPVKKVTGIKEIAKNIDRVLNLLVDKVVAGKQDNLLLSEISLLTHNDKEALGLITSHQSVYVDLVFDLTKEIILERFIETEPRAEPWLLPRKLTPKPPIPASKEVIKMAVDKEVKNALKITQQSEKQRQEKFWSAIKLGRKKRDFVDTILFSELKDEESEWVNYDQDEMTVKLQIADFIFNSLIDDSVKFLKQLKSCNTVS